MIYHVVTLDEWTALPDQPYAPSHLAEDGFVHCAADETTTLAVVNAFYRDTPRPLLAVVIDEDRLASKCVFEAAVPAPPPGATEGVLFPHVFGPINRDAVERVLEVRWDADGRATGLTPWAARA